jgi:hypothetical protein
MIALITVWLNHSGKSYIANQLATKDDKFIVIETDPFRSLIRHNPSLNRLMEGTKDVYTWYDEPNLLGKYLTETIRFVYRHNHIPIIATTNGRKKQRTDLIDRLRRLGYTHIGIVYCNPWLDVIRSRFDTAKQDKDPILYTRGITEENLQRVLSFFEPPVTSEWDFFWETTNTEETQKVIDAIYNQSTKK